MIRKYQPSHISSSPTSTEISIQTCSAVSNRCPAFNSCLRVVLTNPTDIPPVRNPMSLSAELLMIDPVAN